MSTVQEGFCIIEEALEELRQGRMIVLVDDEYRENEGDLVIAAEKVTPEAINFMVRNGCGILGLSLSADICDRLDLEPLPGRNVDAQATPWTPHIDARTGITTGTSAADRARTIRVAVDDATTPADLDLAVADLLHEVVELERCLGEHLRIADCVAACAPGDALRREALQQQVTRVGPGDLEHVEVRIQLRADGCERRDRAVEQEEPRRQLQG